MSRIIVCSSEKSSGVKRSSAAVSSTRKPPPFLIVSNSFVMLDPLEYSSRSHTAADAHRDHSVSCSAPLHFIEKSRGQLGACAAQGMSQSDCSTIDINF